MEFLYHTWNLVSYLMENDAATPLKGSLCPKWRLFKFQTFKTWNRRHLRHPLENCGGFLKHSEYYLASACVFLEALNKWFCQKHVNYKNLDYVMIAQFAWEILHLIGRLRLNNNYHTRWRRKNAITKP